MHHIGESIELTYARGGRTKTIEMKADQGLANYSLVRSEQFDKVRAEDLTNFVHSPVDTATAAFRRCSADGNINHHHHRS